MKQKFKPIRNRFYNKIHDQHYNQLSGQLNGQLSYRLCNKLWYHGVGSLCNRLRRNIENETEV